MWLRVHRWESYKIRSRSYDCIRNLGANFGVIRTNQKLRDEILHNSGLYLMHENLKIAKIFQTDAILETRTCIAQ